MNYHMASARNKDTPLDAEKLLFSADLVQFVVRTKWPNLASKLQSVNGCESYRHSIYNAFNGDIKDAVKMLIDRLSDPVEKRFTEYTSNNNPVDVASFQIYAAEYHKEYAVSEELNVRGLLKYFVSVSLLAGHYLMKDVNDAPEVATNLLVLEMPRDFFNNSDYWDKLNKVASEMLGNNNEEDVPPPVNLNLLEYQEH